MPTPFVQVELARDPRVVVGVGLRRAAAQPLGAEEQQAVQGDEQRGRARRGEHAPKLVLEQEPEDPGRDRPDDEQPAELRVGVVGGDPPVTQRAPEALHDPHPVVPEEPEQDERGREVRGDEERQEVLVVLVDVPAEQPRQDHRMAEARDREELGDTLDQPEDDRPRVGDQREEDHAAAGSASWAPSGTRRKRGRRSRAGRRRSRASRGGGRSRPGGPGRSSAASRRARRSRRSRSRSGRCLRSRR